MTGRGQPKRKESVRWIDEEEPGTVSPPQSTRSKQQLRFPVRDRTGSLGSVRSLGFVSFDLSFKPTEDVTWSTILPQVLACVSAASFHYPVGMVIAYSAVLIPQLNDVNTEMEITKTDASWIASIVVLVVPFTSLLSGYLVDKIGRLKTLAVGGIPYIIGWVLIATAPNLPMLLLGRFLTGMVIAMGPSPAVVYITEVARPELRGSFICTGPSMTSIGMVVIYIQGAYLHWRTIAWSAIIWFIFPVLFISLWSSESPVWLLSKGRNEKALKSLRFLSRRDRLVGVAESALFELVQEFEARKSNQNGSAIVKFFRAIWKPITYKPMVLLICMFLFQQFSGTYITIFYAVSFFQDVGANIDPYVSTVFIGIVRMFMGLLAAVLLRTFGRRTLYMASGTGMALCMFICGFITHEVHAGNMEKNIVPVICILVFVALGVTGLMTVPWTMTAELFALEIRGMAQGIALCIAHIVMFFAIKIYPFLPDMLGGPPGVHWLFSGVSLASVFFIFLFLPETHKKQLYEIQDYFSNNCIYMLRK